MFKAAELAYLFLPDTFPFVAQILIVFRNFELNRPKCIPEDLEDPLAWTFVRPYTNGFSSSLIIPIFLASKSVRDKKAIHANIPLTIAMQTPSLM